METYRFNKTSKYLLITSALLMISIQLINFFELADKTSNYKDLFTFIWLLNFTYIYLFLYRYFKHYKLNLIKQITLILYIILIVNVLTKYLFNNYDCVDCKLIYGIGVFIDIIFTLIWTIKILRLKNNQYYNIKLIKAYAGTSFLVILIGWISSSLLIYFNKYDFLDYINLIGLIPMLILILFTIKTAPNKCL